MNEKEKELLIKIIEEQGKNIVTLIKRVKRLEELHMHSFVPSKN